MFGVGIQAKKEREAKMTEEGWTVVVHYKGGKKTTDRESGVAVGSVAEAAVRDKLAKKKSKDVGLDFYRFQKKEAQRSGMFSFDTDTCLCFCANCAQAHLLEVLTSSGSFPGKACVMLSYYWCFTSFSLVVVVIIVVL